MADLTMLPLLLDDPNLPEETREALRESPQDGAGALVELGVSCADAVELTGADGPCD
jgi:hypothetical protein